jgi:predicted phage terminase large subunit-like protein
MAEILQSCRKARAFRPILQSWDTANKDTELSNFSVCTTWGIKDQHLFLLDVYRRRMDFPTLKRAVIDLATVHRADIVLVEDKASGISLIAELRSQNFSIVQEAPSIDGDKVMRLRGQTAKIAGGFVLFPKEAHWLDTYILELVTFPNSKNDDQVDSTVYALAWSTLHSAVPGILQYYKSEAARLTPNPNKYVRVQVPPALGSHWILITGRAVNVPESRIVEVTQEEATPMLQQGCNRAD